MANFFFSGVDQSLRSTKIHLGESYEFTQGKNRFSSYLFSLLVYIWTIRVFFKMLSFN